MQFRQIMLTILWSQHEQPAFFTLFKRSKRNACAPT